MKENTPKTRLVRVLWAGGCAALLLLGYVWIFAHTGAGIPCALYEWTGIQCAGCGLTRAAAALLRLDVAVAFAENPLWPLFAAYFLWVGLSDAAVYVRRDDIQLLPGRPWMHILILLLVVSFGILRNLW